VIGNTRSASGRSTAATTASGAVVAVRRLAELLFLAPIVLVVLAVIVLPTITVIVHSFTRWNPGYDSPFIGLQNYTQLAVSPIFHQILINQAYLLLGIPLWALAPLLIAVMLHERVPYPGVFRTIFFFPATVSPAIIGILFGFILSPSGPLDVALKAVGLGALARNWLVDANLVRPVLIVVLVWWTIGTGVVIFSAGLSTVPPELFESAAIDGASWWQRLWSIVIPELRHVMELWVVLLVITVFSGLFPWIFTLTRGGPGYFSTTIDFDIYQNALSFGNFGTAAAETVILLALVTIVTVTGSLFFRRARQER
jgi:ABC-type sugar transport system permease subunit